MNLWNFGIVAVFGVSLVALPDATVAGSAETKRVVAIIGTGDMGDSLGPRFAELGYEVVFGSRHPDGDKAQRVARQTGSGARSTTQREAAQAGEMGQRRLS